MSRPNLTETQHRTFQVRATADTEAREFTGIGVPYGQEIDLFGWRESFDAGAIEAGDTALILWRHDEPIGRVTAARDTAAGYEITGKLSTTDRATEAYTLMRDEVITSMSIGFDPIEYRVEAEGTDAERIVWTKVRAREFSLVPFPAYDQATISNVRHAPTPRKDTAMPDTLTRDNLTAELEPITDRLADFERSIDLIKTQTQPPAAPAGAQFRTMGHFLKAIATGDESAAELHRAYAGGTAADDAAKPNFIGEFIKFVEARLTTLNMFTRGTLPADGNTVEFVRMKPEPADGVTAVGKQTAEGADLAGPFKVILEDDNAPIETWGGWTEISRQRIERSQHNYLDKVLRVMGIEWAKYAEKRFKEYLGTVLTARAADALTIPSAPDYTDYLGSIIDAGDYYAANGYALDGLALSPDRFKELALIEAADGRPLMSVYGSGVNTTGELNLPNGHGNLAGVPVSVLWDTAGIGTFFDKAAIQIDMSPGAPAQLQDENIINLTKQYSIYGYAAMYDPFPGGLLPLEYGTAPVEGGA